MNKKDTADLAELVSNLNNSIADIDNGRFEVIATPPSYGKLVRFILNDKTIHECEEHYARWYTLKRNDGLTCYNPEILDRVNRFIVERRGR